MNPPLGDWTGRVCWLVGASTGIGAATATRLHAAGATVVISARPSAALDRVAAELPGASALPVDVTDADAMQAAARTLFARHARVDLVLYCAGTYTPMRAAEFDLAVARRHVDVNIGGALNLLAAVLPALIAQGEGHLSLVASVAGYRGLPRALAYGPTKAALINLAEGLYLDLRPRGIGVSLINPGFVETPLTAQNGFRMPALIRPDDAARHMLRGWAQGQFEIHFPKRFTRWLKALRLIGYRPYFAAVSRSTGL
ncbi:MAG: SDR family NAD(P)-dependent oxidoreductase [Rubrivivax sp.]